ncbi:hypothetical protein NE237_002321 [Protea cynaroides]|uniref:Uncharacterized protein n=1 Tax=Protea cynaroides TaxID=273540 RepID=A0A9Q0QYX7_9MAGN|nr:hypothetical protein NE237_002321 [Protea cynaroides]
MSATSYVASDEEVGNIGSTEGEGQIDTGIIGMDLGGSLVAAQRLPGAIMDGNGLRLVRDDEVSLVGERSNLGARGTRETTPYPLSHVQLLVSTAEPVQDLISLIHSIRMATDMENLLPQMEVEDDSFLERNRRLDIGCFLGFSNTETRATMVGRLSNVSRFFGSNGDHKTMPEERLFSYVTWYVRMLSHVWLFCQVV